MPFTIVANVSANDSEYSNEFNNVLEWYFRNGRVRKSEGKSFEGIVERTNDREFGIWRFFELFMVLLRLPMQNSKVLMRSLFEIPMLRSPYRSISTFWSSNLESHLQCRFYMVQSFFHWISYSRWLPKCFRDSVLMVIRSGRLMEAVRLF